ncbi:Asp-tRNA(Asn)/Glu-tRNA(Gln) amidotransferase subunit GatB [candidate division KSB1 bacterium]|nr:Asp-tRNA(Asn)/Glu-tRNA(Gln) amidotransferase subunit GatB [candidate division KSB1 bacterium]
MKYEAVIGLEVHVQLQTQSKIFSPSSAEFGGDANTKVDPVVIGMPGVLPVLNKKVVEYAIKMGLATNCSIAKHSIFARKHYFYPDLPKGYQISQYEEPICEHGFIEVKDDDGHLRKINIIRIHLEEDAGKSVHAEDYVSKNETLIDLNRAGVPLIEIVTGPDFRSPQEAYQYLTKIRQIVRYLGICDGNMDEGSMRCDANVSVRPVGQKELGTKTELKNMNSIRGVERALEYEIKRQIGIVEDGETIEQETLLWDANKNITITMRSKEYAHDYRYFPDPDLVPVIVADEWRDSIAADLPELPESRKQRFISEFGLPEYDATVLTEERELADYFESTAKASKDPKAASNWIMGDVLRILKDQKLEITDFSVPESNLAELINLVVEDKISQKIGKQVLDEMLASGKTAQKIVEEKGLVQISDSGAIEQMIDNVLAAHPEEFDRFTAGDMKLMGFFIGQIMQASKGKVNPKMASEILRKKVG